MVSSKVNKLTKPRMQPAPAQQAQPRRPQRVGPASAKRIGRPSSSGALIEHEELIDSLTITASGFKIAGKSNGYAINAGSRFTFPWLSRIARGYEKYRFEHLEFELRSANPVTHSGMMYLSVDSDNADPAPASAAEMMANKYNASGVVFNNIFLGFGPAACAALHMPYDRAFVKTIDGTDPHPRSATIGRLYIAAALNQTATFNLIVRYKVRLFEPQLVLEVATVLTGLMVPGAELSSGESYLPFPISNSVGGNVVNRLIGGTLSAVVDVTKVLGTGLDLFVDLKSNSTGLDSSSFAGLMAYDSELSPLTTPTVTGWVKRNSFWREDVSDGRNTLGNGRQYTIDLLAMRELLPTVKYLAPLFNSAVDATLALGNLQVAWF